MLAQTFVGLALALTGALVAAPAESGVLSIRMSGFRSAEGQVLVAIYRGADGFPSEPGKAWQTAVTKVSGTRARVDVTLPPGEYALAIVHDENGNNAMDTSLLGIPREGFGTSNNATRRLGPPRYREARFTVTAAGAVQRVAVVYY